MQEKKSGTHYAKSSHGCLMAAFFLGDVDFFSSQMGVPGAVFCPDLAKFDRSLTIFHLTSPDECAIMCPSFGEGHSPLLSLKKGGGAYE